MAGWQWVQQCNRSYLAASTTSFSMCPAIRLSFNSRDPAPRALKTPILCVLLPPCRVSAILFPSKRSEPASGSI
jgi:hypothetical protein